jgi:hypothetical protein
MKKKALTVILVLVSLIILYIGSCDFRQKLRIEGWINELKGHIPELRTYVIEYDEVLDGLIQIQSRLKAEDSFSIENGGLLYGYFDNNGKSERIKAESFNTSEHLSNNEKDYIGAFISSCPNYRNISIDKDAVRIFISENEYDTSHLCLVNKNTIVDTWQNNEDIIELSGAYQEKINDTWYAVILYMVKGAP